MVRAGDKVISSVGVGEEVGRAEIVWGECADFMANRAIFIKMKFNLLEKAFFTVLYLKSKI